MAVRVTKSGGIILQISGDASQLQEDLKKANALALQLGKDVSKAFSGAFSAGDATKNINTLSKYFINAREAARKNEKGVEDLKNQFMEMGKSIGVAENQMKGFVSVQGKMFQNLAAKSFNDNLKGIQRLTGANVNEMNRLSRSLGGLGNEFKKTDGLILSHAKALKATAAAYVGYKALGIGKDFVGGSVGAAMDFDSIQRSFNAIAGSEALGADQMRFVREEAERLGIDVLVVAKNYRQLYAATKEAGMSQELLRGVFSAVGEQAAILGLSSEQVSRVFSAMAQMVGKGVVSMEEMRQQLGEQLPTALAAAAKGMGVTVAQLVENISNGAVKADEMFRAFTKGFDNSGFAEAAKSSRNEFNRLGNAWTDLKAAFGDGFLVDAANGANDLDNALRSMTPAAELAGGAMGNIILAAVETGKAFSDLAIDIEKASRELGNSIIPSEAWVKDIDSIREAALAAPEGLNAMTEATFSAAHAASTATGQFYNLRAQIDAAAKMYDQLPFLQAKIGPVPTDLSSNIGGSYMSADLAAKNAGFEMPNVPASIPVPTMTSATKKRGGSSGISPAEKAAREFEKQQREIENKQREMMQGFQEQLNFYEKLKDVVPQAGAEYEKFRAQITALQADEYSAMGIQQQFIDEWSRWEGLREAADAFSGLQVAMRDFVGGMTDADVAANIFKLSAYGLTDMLTDTITFSKSAEQAIGDFATSMVNSLARIAVEMMVVRPIVDGLTQSLSSMTGGSLGGGLLGSIGGWIGSLFGGGGSVASTAVGFIPGMASAKGNVFNAEGIHKHVNSIVNRPTIFPFAKGVGLMGEAGAEAIMPLQRDSKGRLGVSVDSDSQGTAAAAPSISINIINQSGQSLSGEQGPMRQDENGNMSIDLVVKAVEGKIRGNMAKGTSPVGHGIEEQYGLRSSKAMNRLRRG